MTTSQVGTPEGRNKWPKQLPDLTPEQRRIRDEFMKLWHEHLPRYTAIERFNHDYPMRYRPQGWLRTIEIGAGLGAHLALEGTSGGDYHAVELRPEMAARIKERFPAAHVVVDDCQRQLPYPDGSFDRAIAIHVLEHLPNLPAALGELRRLLRPEGTLSVVIPCEGGLAYRLARNLSARRLFERHYRQPYDWLIASEHINMPNEIQDELRRYFAIVDRTFFPLMVPSVQLNLCIGLTCTRS